MSLAKRLNDPEYKNWLKCGQALLLLVDGISDLTETTVTRFHQKLKKKPTKIPWDQRLLNEHAMANDPYFRIPWSNVDLSFCRAQKWEGAKLYMSYGQKRQQKITAKDLDATHMLNLWKNCKEFHQHLSDKTLPEQVLKKRNQVMHSSKMKISNADLKQIFKTIEKFLTDKKLSCLPKAQDAIKKIKEVKKLSFDITVKEQEEKIKALEINLISESVKDFQNRYNERFEMLEIQGADDRKAIQQISRDIQDLKNFVYQFEDLKTEFGDQLTDLHSKMNVFENELEKTQKHVAENKEHVDKIEVRVTENETQIGEIKEDVAGYEEQINRKLDAPTLPDLPDYKTELQNALQQCHGTTEPPTYETKEEQGSFKSKVTFKSKHLLQSRPCGSEDEAKKEVAKSALEKLGFLRKDNQLYPYSEPDYKTEKRGIKEFICTLTLLSLEKQNEITVTCMSKTKEEAERNATEKALQLLKEAHLYQASDSSDCKTELENTIQKMQDTSTPPKYVTIQCGRSWESWKSTVTFMSKHLLQSQPRGSEDEAEKEAAESALMQLYPYTKQVYGIEKTTNGKFICTLTFLALEEQEEILVSADESGTTEEDAERLAAKKVLQWLKEAHLYQEKLKLEHCYDIITVFGYNETKFEIFCAALKLQPTKIEEAQKRIDLVNRRILIEFRLNNPQNATVGELIRGLSQTEHGAEFENKWNEREAEKYTNSDIDQLSAIDDPYDLNKLYTALGLEEHKIDDVEGYFCSAEDRWLNTLEYFAERYPEKAVLGYILDALPKARVDNRRLKEKWLEELRLTDGEEDTADTAS